MGRKPKYKTKIVKKGTRELKYMECKRDNCNTMVGPVGDRTISVVCSTCHMKDFYNNGK